MRRRFDVAHVEVKRGEISLLGERGKLFEQSRFADSARTENIQNLKRQGRRGERVLKNCALILASDEALSSRRRHAIPNS